MDDEAIRWRLNVLLVLVGMPYVGAGIALLGPDGMILPLVGVLGFVIVVLYAFVEILGRSGLGGSPPQQPEES